MEWIIGAALAVFMLLLGRRLDKMFAPLWGKNLDAAEALKKKTDAYVDNLLNSHSEFEAFDWDEFGERFEAALEGDPWKEIPQASIDYMLQLTAEVPITDLENMCSQCGTSEYTIISQPYNPFTRRREGRLCARCVQINKAETGYTPCKICKKDSMSLSASGVCNPCVVKLKKEECKHTREKRELSPTSGIVEYHCVDCGNIRRVNVGQVFYNSANESVAVKDFYGNWLVLRPGESAEVTPEMFTELRELFESRYGIRANRHSDPGPEYPYEETLEVDQRTGSILRVPSRPQPDPMKRLLG